MNEDNFRCLCEFTVVRTPAVTCELNHSKQGLQDDPLKKTNNCVCIYIYTRNLCMCPSVCAYINKTWFKVQCIEGMLSFNILKVQETH